MAAPLGITEAAFKCQTAFLSPNQKQQMTEKHYNTKKKKITLNHNQLQF